MSLNWCEIRFIDSSLSIACNDAQHTRGKLSQKDNTITQQQLPVLKSLSHSNTPFKY